MLDIDIKTAGQYSKVFRMLDSDSEGQREAALHQLGRFHQTHGTTFGAILDEAARLHGEEATWRAANDALAAENQQLREFILTMNRGSSVLLAMVKFALLQLTARRLFYALTSGLFVWGVASGAPAEGMAWLQDRYYAMRNVTTAEMLMRQRLTGHIERGKWQLGDGEPFLDRFKDPITGEPVFFWYVLRGAVAEKGEIVNGNAAKLQKRCTYGYAQRAHPRNEPNVLPTPEYFDAPVFRGAFGHITFDQVTFRCAVIPADK